MIVGTDRGLDHCRAPALLSGGVSLRWMAGAHRPLKAALKLEDTCNLHKEGGGVRVQHGPMVLVNPAIPVLMFVSQVASRTLNASVCQRPFIEAGSTVDSTSRPMVSGPPRRTCRTDALCFIQSFHAMMLTPADRLDIDVD